jgi:hypothetical protein
MRHAFVIGLLLSLLAVAPAQSAAFMAGDLPRRAALGFAAEAAEGRLRIVRVEAGSAAEKAGLKTGDEIVAIGNARIANALDGRDQLRRTLANAVLRLGVVRQGARSQITFTAPPRPLEDMPGLDSFYDAVDVGGGVKLRTIVAKPSTARGRLPVILFTQWVSCGSIEYNPQSAWRRALAELVRAQGMALARVERASDGDSEGAACHKLDYDSEVRHYIAAFDRLLSTSPHVDPARVFVVGSSLGSTTAPLVSLALQERGRRILGVSVQGVGAVTHFERMLNF